MKRRNKVRYSLAAACLGMLAAASLSVASAPVDTSTLAQFENSCAAEVQSRLTEGFTLLHCFEYPETTRIFKAIIDQDPDCAIAYWGAAMSVWHPLWAPPSESDLARGAALLKRTDGLEMTPREAAFIDALKAFFSSTDTMTHRQRATAFEAKMSQVHADHLADPEATLFYALALLASADPRDKSYAHQYKAAALLNWIYTSRPRHPGVLHYLIHSYDFPGLAHLALPAAETYADAAPNSTHAQHMPSHIFTRLGLWERSLASNHDSTRSAADYTKRAHLPGHYDEGLHSMDYMMYAMLQMALDDEAKELLATLANIGKTDTENFKVAYTYAAAPARYALERRAWEEASQLRLLRPDFDWSSFGWARSIHHFARGIGAARSGREARAREELAVIEGLRDELPSTTLPYWREEVQVHVDAVRSWIVLAEGKPTEALRLASAAADREDAVDKHPVTPGEVLPARELSADMLLETGRYDDALEQYRSVLRDSPNRLNSLLGAADAAAAMNEAEMEARYRDAAREQTRFGNQERKGLKRVDTTAKVTR
jgi:tetratricopeptide (TPR) repeat protein